MAVLVGAVITVGLVVVVLSDGIGETSGGFLPETSGGFRRLPEDSGDGPVGPVGQNSRVVRHGLLSPVDVVGARFSWFSWSTWLTCPGPCPSFSGACSSNDLASRVLGIRIFRDFRTWKISEFFPDSVLSTSGENPQFSSVNPVLGCHRKPLTRFGVGFGG